MMLICCCPDDVNTHHVVTAVYPVFTVSALFSSFSYNRVTHVCSYKYTGKATCPSMLTFPTVISKYLYGGKYTLRLYKYPVFPYSLILASNGVHCLYQLLLWHHNSDFLFPSFLFHVLI